MIPFFVADRPMSLRLLKGLPLQSYPGVRIGIMAHANTTLNFQHIFRQYPCDSLDYCDAVGGPCQYREDISDCPVRQHILSHTIKMCDSGIFTREGATLAYEQLFDVYARMGVEYGVMIDVFLDPQATLASAKKALKVYKYFKDSFKLVGVAHGNNVGEYLDCYTQLKQMGFKYVAVGGLLQRRKNTVRYPYVRSQDLMFQVLGELRQRYPDDWLFALGSFHPSRLSAFSRLHVWADYKGWIFQYKKQNETLDTHLEVFASNHLRHVKNPEAADHVSTLRCIIAQRAKVAVEHKLLSQKLYDGRRTLRAALASLYQELLEQRPKMAVRFRDLTTHGLLSDTEEKLVNETLRSLGKGDSREGHRILENIRTNRELKGQIESIEARIDRVNTLLARSIVKLKGNGMQLPEETRQLGITIASLIEGQKREHRFKQVQDMITKKILALL